jgi:hypothetical protein
MSEQQVGKFGEPWDCEDFKDPLDEDGAVDSTVKLIDYEDLERACLCVNAFAGVDNPAEEIARMREIERLYKEIK